MSWNFPVSPFSPSAPDTLCVACKGAKMLCGKTRCPVIVRFYARQRTIPMIDSLSLDGSTPPGVFIGQFGYPKVFVGPLIPPFHGDTSVMDLPELWYGKTIEDIVNFRFQLVRGKYLTDIYQLEGNKIVETTRELALSVAPAEIEAKFEKRPNSRIILNDEVQPFGPSAPIRKIETCNIKFDQRIEKVFYDTDLRAIDAVLELYRAGTFVTKIQRAFSVGAFGHRKKRKFVPTRWSITAVDSIISSELMKRTKTYPLMNEYRVYETVALDNRWVVLFLPIAFCYELIEAWYPHTIWNPLGKRIVMFSDHEHFSGRTTYAQIGGCYYAARVAVNELLEREHRQAGVIVLRESHPGYIMPVGVWNVRENVRAALRKPSLKFNTLQETLAYVSTKLEIPIREWVKHSAILQELKYQKTLDSY